MVQLTQSGSTAVIFPRLFYFYHASVTANGSINGLAVDASGNVYATGNFTNAGGKYYVVRYGM